MVGPMNLEGVAFYDVRGISVNEWHALPDGEGDPEQVHLWLEVEGFPGPFVVRFKTARPVDELIVALIAHRRGVWGAS